MVNKQFSFGGEVWQRLKKNTPASVALFFIFVTVLISILGYLITPDPTPYADHQTVEIQAKNPGYQQMFLKIPHLNNSKVNWFQQLLYGKPSNHKHVPIKGYVVQGNDLQVMKYVDDDTAILQHYSITQLTGSKSESIQEFIGTNTYWLGTDSYGRDLLSRLIIGARVSMAVGLIAVIVSMLFGISLGAIAGFYGGVTDKVIMWLVNVIWSVPTLLLVFAITIAAGKGFWQIFIAIGLTMWVGVARLVRGQVMAVKQMEYIQSAKTLGFTNGRIILRHILPNIIGPLLVIASANFATAIIIEAGLSFLGIGVQPPQPSWGFMLKENYNFIITHRPLLALIPGIAIMLLVLAFNILGNGLRDAMDVKR